MLCDLKCQRVFPSFKSSGAWSLYLGVPHVAVSMTDSSYVIRYKFNMFFSHFDNKQLRCAHINLREPSVTMYKLLFNKHKPIESNNVYIIILAKKHWLPSKFCNMTFDTHSMCIPVFTNCRLITVLSCTNFLNNLSCVALHFLKSQGTVLK